MTQIFKVQFFVAELSEQQYIYLLRLSEIFHARNDKDNLDQIIFEFPKISHDDLLKNSNRNQVETYSRQDTKIHLSSFQS